MSLSKEDLLKRLETFKFQKDQFLANANAAQGAILLLEELLKEIDADPDIVT